MEPRSGFESETSSLPWPVSRGVATRVTEVDLQLKACRRRLLFGVVAVNLAVRFGGM
jgi:hypothetical protein